MAGLVRSRRERFALATMAGATFEKRAYGPLRGPAPRRWFIKFLPRKMYFNGPYRTRWQAVEAAHVYLEERT